MAWELKKNKNMAKIIKNKIVYEENINNLAGKANAIVFPDNVQEIKNLIKLSEIDIVPRGSGTSFTGACIPKNSVVIDFSKMNKILAINQSTKTAIVEPGVLLSELNEELEQYGLEFPINPIFGGIETIGGMIAKNSAGNREIKYGRMINWIDAMEVVNGKGEQQRISRSDISDFVGLEGSTGAIVQAILRLTNKKQKSISILKANTLQDIFVANRKLRLKQDICSIDLVNPEISFYLGLEKKYHIFVEVDSLEGSFQGENYQKFIKLKNKAYKKAAMEGFCYMTNVRFLIDSLQDFLIYLEDKNIPFMAHLASGVVYPMFKPENLEKIDETMKFARKLRGKIAYNFGVGLTKKDTLDAGEIEIIRRVKNRQDPQWKMNQNKLIDIHLKNIKKSPEQEEDTKEELKAEAEAKEEKQNDNKIETNSASELIEASKKEEANLFEKNTQNAQNSSQTTSQATLKRKDELTPEEREKIKKIAGGFFGGVKKKDN